MFSGSIDREQFYETGCFDGIFALVCSSEWVDKETSAFKSWRLSSFFVVRFREYKANIWEEFEILKFWRIIMLLGKSKPSHRSGSATFR